MNNPLDLLRQTLQAFGATADDNIPVVDVKIQPFPVIEVDTEIPLAEIQVQGHILTYQGTAIVIYIKDHRSRVKHRFSRHESGYTSPKEWLAANPGEGNRYHLTWCSTLAQMCEEGRMGRYVKNWDEEKPVINGGNQIVSDANGNPVFPIEFDGTDHEIALQACQNCLKIIYQPDSWKKWLSDVKEFKLQEWLDKVSATLFCPAEGQFHTIPEYTAGTVPANKYSKNWYQISQKIRRAHNYKCSDCGESYNCRHKGLLHLHHKNMQKGDNRGSNLEVLCVKCHEKRHPGHRFLRAYKKDLEEHEAECKHLQV